jgi:glycosyltransferase involved in cell wall biosynthesis
MTGSSRKRRILLVTNWIGWSGAETQVEYLAIGLRQAGHEVELLAIGDVLRDTDRLGDAGVNVQALHASDRSGKLRVLPEMVRRARRADVVHCTGWDATFWGRVAATAARRPAVFTEHTPGRELQTTASGSSRVRVIQLHNRLLNRFTYAAIVVGVWQKELLESEGVRGTPIVHIPNAVPVDELRERAAQGPDRASLGIPEGAPVVVQVARFHPQKRQAVTLRAVERLRGRFGDVRLLFLGTGPDEEGVREEADRLGADWVSFLGYRGDVPALVALSDLSVLPSTGEGLPMSLIESIVLGTPTVGTDVGDVRWLLETTEAGICVQPEDEEAFVEACARILGDPELRQRMAGAGIRTAPMFDAPRMVERYEEVLEAAVQSTPLRQPSVELQADAG